MTDEQLIDALGGATRVCEMLGYSKLGGVQRVHNWKLRGIPAAVKLERPDLFMRQPAAVGAPMVPGSAPAQLSTVNGEQAHAA